MVIFNKLEFIFSEKMYFTMIIKYNFRKSIRRRLLCDVFYENFFKLVQVNSLCIYLIVNIGRFSHYLIYSHALIMLGSAG